MPGERTLTMAQLDRAAGVALASAVGDALGAGYEFGPPLPPKAPVAMIGGNGAEPSEWTDDTAMTWPILRAAAQGLDLRSEAALAEIAEGWWQWFCQDPPDVGLQTSAVLREAARSGPPTPERLRRAAALQHRRTGRSAGNGSLMRTAPVALAHLDDPEAIVAASVAISGLTHHDPQAGEACALWSLAIRHAVLTGELDLRAGLLRLPADRAAVWAARIDDAETRTPGSFEHNGWVVQALQAAWSAIRTTAVPAHDPESGSHTAQHLALALSAAVRGGRDADTVAAIAGGLLGAAWGASAVPLGWQRALHGWGGVRRDLSRLAVLAALGGGSDAHQWPEAPWMGSGARREPARCEASPVVPGVVVGSIGCVSALPEGVSAVVSLTRLGALQHPAPGLPARDHVEAWIVDSPEAAENPNLDLVLAEAEAVVADMRDEGHTVLVHGGQHWSTLRAAASAHGPAAQAVLGRLGV